MDLLPAKKYTEARKYLQNAVYKDPEHPVMQYHLGFCAAKLGDTAVARQALEKALASESKFPEREEVQKLLKSLPQAGK